MTIARRIGGLALIALVAACSQTASRVVAMEPAGDTPCALDGMILKDFPGPKAQIRYMEGKPDFFCELTELFTVILRPEQQRAIAGMFVQDIGKTDWDRPQGNWIDAKTAIYVVGSHKRGSMGPTFGAFSRMQDAETFMRKEGGRIASFAEIRAGMLGTPSDAVGDTRM